MTFLDRFFEESSKIKFHKIQSSGSRVVQCGRMDEQTNGQTGMKKLIISIRNFAKAPTNEPKESNSKDLIRSAQ